MKKFIFLLFLLNSAVSYALPFDVEVKSGTSLPTTYYAAPVTAYYTVTNNTQSQRNNNFVKYLPPYVSQVTTGGTYPDTCGSAFNLAPSGQSGSSCTLQLSVAGPVSASDPNPQDHLFVCLNGGMSCAGTPSPLNVIHPSLLSISVTPTTASINALATQQYTATGTYGDGTTQNITSNVSWDSGAAIASVSTSGLAQGITSGSTSISSKLGGITSNSATLNVTAYAYTANTNSNNIIYCPINQNGTGSFSSCSTTGAGLTKPYSLAITPDGSYLYIGATAGSSQIIACSVNSNGSLTCGTAISGTPTTVNGMTINSAGTYLYLTTGNSIEYCSVGSGTLTGCATTGSTVNSASGISLNPAGTFAYVASNTDGKIDYCSVNTNGSLSNCSVFSSGLTSPVAVTFNYAGNIIYITNGSDTVTYCNVNSDGSAGTCKTMSGISNLAKVNGLMINGGNTFAYAVEGAPNHAISYCTINYDGSFNTCTVGETGLNSPFGIVVS